MQILLNPFKIGRGIWKFNNSLLRNKDYLNLINNAIVEEKLKYALPIYTTEFVKNSNKDISFKIDDDNFLEMVLLRIRGESIKFASHIRK